MYRFEDRSGNDSIGEALDILNSGNLNFATVSENASSASKVISLKVFEATPETMASHGIPGSSLGYLSRGSIYHNAGASDGDLDRVIGNVVHEALHTSRDIDRLVREAAARPEFASFSFGEKVRLKTILEEKALRDVLSEIDARSDLFSLSDGRFNYNGTNIQEIINGYDNAAGRGNLLSPEQEAIIVQFVADTYRPPVFELNGAIYSANANGDYEPYSLVDGAPGDNIIGDGFAYDYTQDIDSESVAEIGSDGTVVVSPFPVPRPDGLTGPSPSTSVSSKPIIIDLDGDGIEVSLSNEVSFDLDEDGFLERTTWVGEDDGFLVLDLAADGSIGSGDGVINQARELALSLWGAEGVTDLQALAEATDASGDLLFDSNGDGVLSAADTHWGSFHIWQDANQNGLTDAGELLTLGGLGITSINLTYDDGTAFDDTSNDVDVFGNSLLGLASLTRNGATEAGAVGDTALVYNSNGWRRIETSLGYDIELETGELLHYAELEETGAADLNLGALSLDGTTGDSRVNILNAETSLVAVTISGRAGDDQIHGGALNDTLSGDDGNDQIIGGNGQNFLSGGIGNDLLIGGDDNDVLSGGSDDDLLRGGLGDDTYLFNLTDGDSVIDESVFQVTHNGTTFISTETSEFSSAQAPVDGKDVNSTKQWVHDTLSGATVESMSGGHDTVLFGEGIGIADIVLSSNERTPELINDLDLDFDVTIGFVDAAELAIADTSLTVRNWGDQNFQVDEFIFSRGQEFDLTDGSLNVFQPDVAHGVSGTSTADTIDGLATSIPGVNIYVGGIWVTAFGGNDTIIGTSWSDFINGGSGDDLLSGSTGETYVDEDSSVGDQFIFNEDDGDDIITDFELGYDRIVFDIEGMLFSDVAISDSANGALIEYDTDDSITLNGVLAADLTDSEFIFA